MAASQHALILFAHGARDAGWRKPVDALAERMALRNPQLAVSVAFLEFMQPSLEQAVDQFAQRGATHITIAPVFISPGGHVKHDVPVLLDAARARHPRTTITMLPTLGEMDSVLDAIATGLTAALPATTSP